MIDVLFLTMPGEGSLLGGICDGAKFGAPYFDGALDFGRHPVGGCYSEWEKSLRGRNTRLYVSVGVERPDEVPPWVGGWGDALGTLVANSRKVVVVKCERTRWVYDMLQNGWSDIGLLEKRHRDALCAMDALDCGLVVDQEHLDGRRNTLAKLSRYAGMELRPAPRRTRGDKALFMEVFKKWQPPKDGGEGLFTSTLDGGKLGMAAVYFNYCGYRTLSGNFKRFLYRFRDVLDDMLVIELAYGDKPFELTGLAPNMLRIRGSSVLWHKENLINIGTKVLRERGYSNVGWIDGDTDLSGSVAEWFGSARDACGENRLVQLFEKGEHRFSESGYRGRGAAAELSMTNTDPSRVGKTGLGWAVDGHVWDRLGWYDKSIIGSGDRLAFIAAAKLSGHYSAGLVEFKGNKAYRDDYMGWARQWNSLDVSFLDGVVANMDAHGTIGGRGYASREEMLRDVGFDPARDLVYRDDGLLEWSPEASESLKSAMVGYFEGRMEDGVPTESIETDEKDIGFVAVYFNYCGYKALRKNFERFMERFAWLGDRLLIVELAYGGKPFDMTGKHPNMMQVRGDDVMWHKENLINVGTKRLREQGYENVGWLDGDAIIDDCGEDWYKKCVDAMKEHNLIQVAETIITRFPGADKKKYLACAEYMQTTKGHWECYTAGLGWIIRGELWDKCHYYDRSILGDGDLLNFVGSLSDALDLNLFAGFRGKGAVNDLPCYLGWVQKWRNQIKNRVSFLSGVSSSVEPHGSAAGRQYGKRTAGLVRMGYNSETHVAYDEKGVLQWTKEASDELKQFCMMYFINRKEDA